MASRTHAAALAALELPAPPADYLADDATVSALARGYAAGAEAQGATRATYLRILLAHTQAALGAPRPTLVDARRFATLDPAAAAAQGRALKATHERLYGLVLAAITTSDLEDSSRLSAQERKRRALLRNQRSNFARSAASVLRSLSRALYDLHEIGVKDAAKGRLAALARKRSPEAHSADDAQSRRAAIATARAITALELLAEGDHAGAIQAGQLLIDRAAALLLSIGTPSARSPEKATTDRVPLKTHGATFWPVYRPEEARTN
jgi:hypothetical protein